MVERKMFSKMFGANIVAVVLAVWFAIGCVVESSADEIGRGDVESIESGRVVRVNTFNHASIDIAVSPNRVWREIVDTYVEGGGFSDLGYTISPLTDDPSAFRGGYRMTLKDESGAIVDERKVYITGRDDAARRLSVYAQYLSGAFNGLEVYATYQAVPIEGGARYNLDAHSRIGIALKDAKDSKNALAETIKGYEQQSQEFLETRFDELKVRLESEG